MAGEEYSGVETVVEWTSTGGTLVDLSGTSRTAGWNEQGSEVDAGHRSNPDAALPGRPNRTASLSGVDTKNAESMRQWWDIDIGDTGLLTIYPEGKADGMPFKSAQALVTQSNFESPYDNVVTYNLAWRLTSTPTKGEYEAP